MSNDKKSITNVQLFYYDNRKCISDD